MVIGYGEYVDQWSNILLLQMSFINDNLSELKKGINWDQKERKNI